MSFRPVLEKDVRKGRSIANTVASQLQEINHYSDAVNKSIE